MKIKTLSDPEGIKMDLFTKSQLFSILLPVK
jgi:hypothetical protein